MLAYRHLFHAGNFADVFKHALLTRLLIALARKDKPFLYLDTHAGTGLYDLAHGWAEKLAEHRAGIDLVWQREDAPAAFQPYLAAVRADNGGASVRFYPGSPRIARRFLRPGDRMELNELNRDDCAALARRFERDEQVHVHCMDAYQALKALLPPPERRGLVLIDSSFDRAREFDRLVEGLMAAYKRWASGVFALWYPLLEPYAMHAFDRQVVASGIHKVLKLELAVLPDGWAQSLRGCGMLVVNPPFGFEAEARPMLDWLWRVLAEAGTGRHTVGWLVPE